MSSTRLTQLMAFYETNPKDSFILFAMAKEHENLGNTQNALELYLQIKGNDPNYTGLYYHLGKLYEQMEEINLAFSTYREGMEICQKVGDQHAYSELAGAKLNLGDDDDFD